MLQAGAGPRAPADARCPGCGGELRGFWHGYERVVRFPSRLVRLQVGLPLPRLRQDARALAELRRPAPAGCGSGDRGGAGAGRGRGGGTGRSRRRSRCLRRRCAAGYAAPARAALATARLWRFAQELGSLAPRLPAGEPPLAVLLRAAAATHAAAVARFGAEGLPDRFGLAVAPRRRGAARRTEARPGRERRGAARIAATGEASAGRCAMGGSSERKDWREREALFRYSLIRAAADERSCRPATSASCMRSLPSGTCTSSCCIPQRSFGPASAP